jgi:hypothetical protein
MLPGVRRAAGVIALTAAAVAGCSLGVGGLSNSLSSGDGGPGEGEPTADGGDPSQKLPKDGGTAAHDSGPQPDAMMPTPPMPDGALPQTDAGSTACPDPSGACLVVPAGWALVAFAGTQASPCPTGFAGAPPTDLVEGPSAAGACSCGACTVSTPPTCDEGTVTASYDVNTSIYAGTCYLPATGSPLKNSPPGGCGTDAYQGIYATYDMKYVAPPASGGTCSAPGVANSGGVTYAARDRACTPDSDKAAGCVGGMCQPDLPAGFAACIAYPGAVACPPGPLSVGHLVGASASATCADCSCTISATCSGTLTLYTDTDCAMGAYPISTGSCVSVESNAKFNSYAYKGGMPKSVSCKAAAASAMPGVALAGEQTICCTQ